MKRQFEIFGRPSEYKVQIQIHLVFVVTALHHLISANTISTNIYDKEPPLAKKSNTGA